MKQQPYDDLLRQLKRERLPRHIAVIMDGNGRWAKEHMLPRSAGHKAGMEALRSLTEICREIGVQAITVYAFSTENWRRPAEEVGFLMRLFIEYLRNEVKLMNAQDIRLGFIGRREGLPAEVRLALERSLTATKNNRTMSLNIAVNYGGRDELTRAARDIARAVARGEVKADDIDEQLISAHLDTAALPDPDLLIRPSGELRLSNFLLWQTAYSELYFSDKMWPDFGKRDVLLAVLDYQRRDRRFGGVK